MRFKESFFFASSRVIAERAAVRLGEEEDALGAISSLHQSAREVVVTICREQKVIRGGRKEMLDSFLQTPSPPSRRPRTTLIRLKLESISLLRSRCLLGSPE